MPGKKLSIMLPVDLARMIRERVKATPGLTVTAVIESAVRRTLERLEGLRGSPYPTRKGALLTGRPLNGKNAAPVQRTVITTYTGAELQERLRNALYWTRTRMFQEIERELRQELGQGCCPEGLPGPCGVSSKPKYRRKAKPQAIQG